MKRVFSLILALVLMIRLMPAVSASETIASGTCGENLTWVLTEDGTLTISGAGEMDDYTNYSYWDDTQGGFVTVCRSPSWEDYSENIITVIVNNGVTSIGGAAFDFHHNLIHVELPSSLFTIGDEAFTASRSLNSINLPDGLQSIGENAFKECESLNSITLPGSLVEWNDAFCNSGLKIVTICDGISKIPEDAFERCDMLEQITIPSSVKTIGKGAFSSCESLVEIEIPNGVEEIEAGAFSVCRELVKVTLPDSLKGIGENVFSACNKLESITLPSSVSEIGSKALSCPNLKAVHVDAGNHYYSSDATGVLYNKAKTILVQFPLGLTGFYAIPEGVTTLGNHSFSYANINALSIPASVTAFGSSTFFYNYYSYDYTIRDIYYAGSLEQWQAIECAYYDAGYNDGLDKARMHYNSTNPEEHPYVPAILAPTCTEQGYTTYTCSCGHSYVDDHVDALGHDYKGGVCTRCGVEDPDYFNPFTDVPAGCWYEAPVLWALENGVTSGSSDTTFSPADKCLRAHVVTFLWNAG